MGGVLVVEHGAQHLRHRTRVTHRGIDGRLDEAAPLVIDGDQIALAFGADEGEFVDTAFGHAGRSFKRFRLRHGTGVGGLRGGSLEGALPPRSTAHRRMHPVCRGGQVPVFSTLVENVAIPARTESLKISADRGYCFPNHGGRMRYWIGVLIAATVGCGNDATGPTPKPADQPARVVVVTATVAQQLSGERVTADLRNEGGPGVFKIQAFGAGSGVNAPPFMWGETESFEVSKGWTSPMTFTVTTGRAFKVLRTLVVLTRNTGSVEWRETHRFTIP